MFWKGSKPKIHVLAVDLCLLLFPCYYLFGYLCDFSFCARLLPVLAFVSLLVAPAVAVAVAVEVVAGAVDVAAGAAVVCVWVAGLSLFCACF